MQIPKSLEAIIMMIDFNEIIDLFNKLNDDDKYKEVYAHFGRTIFYAQVIEQQAINMIAIYKQANGSFKSFDEVNSLWDNYDLGSRNLGTLINEIKQLYNITDEDSKELIRIIKLRNYYAHNYFRFNSELFYTDAGKKRMIRDFVEFTNSLKSLDFKLKEYLKVYTDRIGMSEEFMESIYQKTKKEWEQKNISDDHKTIPF